MRRGLAGLFFNHVPPARATACQQKTLTGRGTGRSGPAGAAGVGRESERQVAVAVLGQHVQDEPAPDDAAVDVVGLVVDCVHERGHDGGRLLGGHDVEVEREDLVALCNGDTFGV